ncbi:hypothetical protein GSB9_01424 [Flavobacteriaceae bacterium GSB9]|nr:hypothetical protein GSB9_01424 [Flavobacteriaceae bacterium GSB9]
MEPYKHEQEFKSKLEQRKIQPSAEAWNKLSERLDSTEKTEINKNKTVWFIGIAASVVGLLFLGLQFWPQDSKTESTPKVVNTPKVEINTEINAEDLNNQIAKENVETNILKTVNTAVEKDKPKTEIIFQQDSTTPTQVAINEASLEKVEKENEVTSTKQESTRILSFEEQKIQEVAAKVEAMKQKNSNVTDSDIDALLFQAQKEIQLNKLINKSTGMVDAEALLEDVGAELDQSFRNKVFEAIKSSYNSVKTAVAQRND